MAGITGVNANTANMISQMLSASTGGKKSQGSSSFAISTSTITSSISSLTSGRSSSAPCTLGFQYYNTTAIDGKKYSANVPMYTGLTRAEPTITKEDLTESIISLAKEASESGKDYTETGKEMLKLVEKYICGISPDRASAYTKGNPAAQNNGNAFNAKIYSENGECVADYWSNHGQWHTMYTKEELAASQPFGDLFYKAFNGLDYDDALSKIDKVNVPSASASTTNTTVNTNVSVDYKA